MSELLKASTVFALSGQMRDKPGCYVHPTKSGCLTKFPPDMIDRYNTSKVVNSKLHPDGHRRRTETDMCRYHTFDEVQGFCESSRLIKMEYEQNELEAVRYRPYFSPIHVIEPLLKLPLPSISGGSRKAQCFKSQKSGRQSGSR